MKRNAARAPHPTALNENEPIDRLALTAQDVVLAVNHVARRAAQLFRQRLAYRLVADEREIFEHAPEAVRAVSLVKHLSKLRQLAQQTQRGPRHFEHDGTLPLRHRDGRVALDAGEQSHLTETCARFEPPDFLLPVAFANVDVECAVDGDVERVTAPLTLAHDVFAAVVREQSNV